MCSRRVNRFELTVERLPCEGQGLQVSIGNRPMEDEELDVVDASDVIVGAEARKVVHALGLRHRAVHIVVVNLNNETFLQRRSRFKDIAPGFWDTSAAGHLNRGESYDQSAVRELQEELGIVSVAPLERLFKLDATSQTGWEFVWVYRCVAEGPFVLAPDEIECGAWFSPAAMEHLLMCKDEMVTATLRIIWRRLTNLP